MYLAYRIPWTSLFRITNTELWKTICHIAQRWSNFPEVSHLSVIVVLGVGADTTFPESQSDISMRGKSLSDVHSLDFESTDLCLQRWKPCALICFLSSSSSSRCPSIAQTGGFKTGRSSQRLLLLDEQHKQVTAWRYLVVLFASWVVFYLNELYKMCQLNRFHGMPNKSESRSLTVTRGSGK